MDKYDELLEIVRGLQAVIQAGLASRSALQVSATQDRFELDRIMRIVERLENKVIIGNGEPSHVEQIRQLQGVRRRHERFAWIVTGAFATALVAAIVLWATNHLRIV